MQPKCPKHKKSLVERDKAGAISKYDMKTKGAASERVDLICPVEDCTILSGPECPRCKRFYRLKQVPYTNPDLPKKFFYCPRENAVFP
jgi:hypothetical protein